VVGAEMQSKCVEINDRGRYMAVLFGDGAGAVVVSATEVESAEAKNSSESCIYSTHLHADGRFAKDLLWASPGTANRVWNPPELVAEPAAFPQMNGRLVFTHAVRRMPEVAREALEANGVTADDVDLFINHQANARINEKFADAMGVGKDKVFDTVDAFANTTAATIPIGLYEARKAGLLERGKLVSMATFGSGFTWASALLRW
ncbi:MAG: 3-oxoacyl-[acyl-carrier-protein] synthase-3, partial [Gammaproteobacteria bacterium]